MRGESGRSSLVVQSFPIRQTHGCTHVFFIRGKANSRLEKLLLPFLLHPAGTEKQGAFGRWHSVCSAGCPATLLPSRTWPAMPGRCRAALTPADCPAQGAPFPRQQKSSSWTSDSCWTHGWPEELGRGTGKQNDPELTIFSLHYWYAMLDRQTHNGFSTLLHNKIRSVVGVVGGSQLLSVG